MPLARITLIKGKSSDYLSALAQSVHASLVEAYDMDDRDRFQIIEEIEPGRLIYSRDYAGGPRSENFVVIAIESMPRTGEMKEAFYKRLKPFGVCSWPVRTGLFTTPFHAQSLSVGH